MFSSGQPFPHGFLDGVGQLYLVLRCGHLDVPDDVLVHIRDRLSDKPVPVRGIIQYRRAMPSPWQGLRQHTDENQIEGRPVLLLPAGCPLQTSPRAARRRSPFFPRLVSILGIPVFAGVPQELFDVARNRSAIGCRGFFNRRTPCAGWAFPICRRPRRRI
jgi:hypothetical protein